MTQLALAAQVRNVFLCTLAALTLTACGESGATNDPATAAASDALVSSNIGMIDRSHGIGETDGTGSVGSNAPSTAPGTAATTPPSGSSNAGTSGSGSTSTGTTVANNGGNTTPPITTMNGAATLDWMPPTRNSDGSALTNLAGYTVYYGTSANNLSQSVKVSNPGLAAYTITGLTSGTWYFAVTSYSADGVESGRTATVSTKI